MFAPARAGNLRISRHTINFAIVYFNLAFVPTDNVNDGSAAVTSVVFSANTVKVSLESDQPSFFARNFGVTETAVRTTATAQWTQPAIPLPLAYHRCALPSPSAVPGCRGRRNKPVTLPRVLNVKC